MATRQRRTRRQEEPVDDTDSFLMGSGESIPGTFLKRHKVGTIFEGKILDKKMRQQTDPKSQEKKFWDNGDPMMQLVVTIQTDLDDEPNEETGEDDGRRNLYLRYKSAEAVRDAVKAAGEKSLKIGGYLLVEYVGDGKAANKAVSGPKLFEAEYTPPETDEGDEFLNGDDDDADDEPAPRRRRRPAAKKTTRRRQPEPDDDDAEDDDDDAEDEPPRRRRKPAAKKTTRRSQPEPDEDDEDDDAEDEPAPRRRRPAAKKTTRRRQPEPDDDDEEDDEPAPRRRRSTSAAKKTTRKRRPEPEDDDDDDYEDGEPGF